MPYTCYFRAKTACRFSEGSSCCRSCIKVKKPYNSVLQKEWDKKEEAVREELLRLHKELA
ncbi:hypothetical protein CSPAE12_02915 [Colletotrichum incanum]|nr:hypothetical protein CSPAE12_02915 [Colletotrichum incanum]